VNENKKKVKTLGFREEEIMNYKGWILVLIIIIKGILFAGEFQGAYEEGYIGIEVNTIVEHTFFPVYMDFKEQEPYVGLRNLMILVDARAMKLDLENKRLVGKIGEEEKEFSYSNTTYIERDGEVFVKGSDLGKVFPIKKIEWDSEKYTLKIKTQFKTPVENYLEGEERRAKIGENDEDISDDLIYRNERKLFTPGVIRPRYTDTDLGSGNESVSMRYDTHLLYGDFTSTYFLRPDSDLGNISLTYNEVIEDKSIVLGDTFIRGYNFLNTSSVRGGAIQPWFSSSSLEVGATKIKGFAPYRSTVELYQNGSLLRFQTVGENGQYEFTDIRIEGYRDVYTVKIFNFDGTIETKEVSLLSNKNIVKKGELEYLGAIGKDPDDDVDDDLQYNAKVAYGVTDRLTFAVGYMDVLSRISDDSDIFDITINDDDEDDDIETVNNKLVETAIYYTTGAQRYPTYFELVNLYDTNESDNTHIGIIRQKVNENTLSLEAYDYSKVNTRVTGSERTYLLDWRGRVSRDLTYNLFYSQREEPGEEFQSLGANLFLRFDETSHSLGVQYGLSPSDEPTVLNYSYSNSKYSIFKLPINIVLQATVDVEEPSENALYSLIISKRGDKKLDVSFEIETDTEEYEFIFEISYKLTNWLEILGGAIRDEDGTEATFGIDAEKTIILEKPLIKNSNPSPDSSWMEGKVFLDYDGDRVMDEEDILMENVTVKVGRQEAITDSEGRYFIDDISSYEDEELEIDITTIDPLLEAGHEKKYVRLFPARGGEVDIPLQPISIVMGDIVFPEESMGEMSKFSILSRINILLKDKKGKVIKTQKVSPEGYYMMERVLPGEYILEIEYNGEDSVTFNETVKEIKIRAGKYGDYYEGYNFEIRNYIFK